MNFILSLLFLAGAIGVFGYQAVTGDRNPRIVHTDISVGWILLMMTAYNLVRWWSVRSYQIQQWEMRQQAARVRERYRTRQREDRPIDPNFDFTNEPAIQPAPPTQGPQAPNANGPGEPV